MPWPRRMCLGALARGGEEGFRRRRVRIFLEEMMLHHPGVVVAEPVGSLELRQRVLVEPELVALLPRPRQLQLIEDAELHDVSPDGPCCFSGSVVRSGSRVQPWPSDSAIPHGGSRLALDARMVSLCGSESQSVARALPRRDPMPQFTPHQDSALKAVADWLKAKPGRNGTPPVFRLFGYAGTGKTTLARHIAEGVNGEVKFAAFTGKAALVMRNKGCDNASTIHSLIYRATRIRRRTAELRIVGRCAGLEGEADRDRRMLDGRCRTRPRPDVVRMPAAGARRPRAIAADPGRRLLHRLPSPTRC